MATLIRNFANLSKLDKLSLLRTPLKTTLLNRCGNTSNSLQHASTRIGSNVKPAKLHYMKSSTVVKAAVVGSIAYIFYSEKVWTMFGIKTGSEPVLKIKGSDPYKKSSYTLMYDPPSPKTLAASIVNPQDKTGLKLTLYQYKTCPFCCKVRSFLDFYGFSYDVVEVNSVTRKETKWSSYKKVPFVVVSQSGSEEIFQLKDSSMIISCLKSFLVNKNLKFEQIVGSYPIIDTEMTDGKKVNTVLNRFNVVYGEEQKNKDDTIQHETKWRQWVDDVYIHYLSVNIYRTMAESKESFQWFSKAGKWDDLFSTWEKMLVLNVGPVAMYFISRRLRKKYEIGDDVRESFYMQTNTWLNELKKSKSTFMGGAQPDLSDLAVYGVLTAIEGCETFQDLKSNTDIGPWFEQMQKAVNNHGGKQLLESYSK